MEREIPEETVRINPQPAPQGDPGQSTVTDHPDSDDNAGSE